MSGGPTPLRAYLCSAFAGAAASVCLLLRYRHSPPSAEREPSLRDVSVRHWKYGCWGLGTVGMAWAQTNSLSLTSGYFLGLSGVGGLNALISTYVIGFCAFLARYFTRCASRSISIGLWAHFEGIQLPEFVPIWFRLRRVRWTTADDSGALCGPAPRCFTSSAALHSLWRRGNSPAGHSPGRGAHGASGCLLVRTRGRRTAPCSTWFMGSVSWLTRT
jgi:hypothetical protein